MARILFVQNTFFRSPSLMLLSAVVKRGGHTVDIIITSSTADLKQKIITTNPDIVGFSCVTGNEKSLLPLSIAAKQASPHVYTLWGGPHPTYFQKLIHEDGVDIICVGEGEYPTLELLDSLESGQLNTEILNLTFKQGEFTINNELRQLNDLDEIPFADQYLYEHYPLLHNSETRQIFTGRGCPHSCNFCFTTKQRELYKGKGRYCRKRSVENVIAEIVEISKSFPVSMYNFIDDTFASDNNWALRFLNAVEKLKITFFVVLRFDEITPALAERLSTAGCKIVIGSIETADEQLRNEVINKKMSTSAIETAVKTIKSYNMKVSASNMFAFPGDTTNNAFNTVKLNIDFGIDIPMFFIFTPHPGTRLTDLAIKSGQLEETFIDKLGFDMRTVLLTFPKRDVEIFENLVRLANFTCRFPFIYSLLPTLTRLPLLKVYDVIDKICRVSISLELGQFSLKTALCYAWSRILLDMRKVVSGRRSTSGSEQ